MNARVGRELGATRLTLYGCNLTDERYYTLIVPGVFNTVPAMPPTWGIELTVRAGR